MLHGRDIGQLDVMRENIIFVRATGMQCADLSQRTGTGPLGLYEYGGLRNNYAHQIGPDWPASSLRAFDFCAALRIAGRWMTLSRSPATRAGSIFIRHPRASCFRSGKTRAISSSSTSRAVGPRLTIRQRRPRRPPAGLEEMLSWLSPLPEDRAKIMQMWAFKAQCPLIKPQFALGISGGQGIGKGFVLHDLPRLIFGLTVKRTSADMMFGDRFPLQPAIGASFIIVDEVSNLGNMTSPKTSTATSITTSTSSARTRAQHRIFAIPIYMTNDPHPQFNKPGEIDRTLYIIQAPDQSSLKLNRSAWAAFELQRKQEVIAKVEWLNRPDIRAGHHAASHGVSGHAGASWRTLA